MVVIFNSIYTKLTSSKSVMFFKNRSTGNQMAAICNWIYAKLLLSSCTKLHSIANVIMVHFTMSYLLITLFFPTL